MKITTNWQPRDLQDWHGLPHRVQSDFDYLSDDDKWQDRFVEYKGEWYDVFDTQCLSKCPLDRRICDWPIQPDHPFWPWDSVASESAFSGVLFKWTTDDRIIVGRYYA